MRNICEFCDRHSDDLQIVTLYDEQGEPYPIPARLCLVCRERERPSSPMAKILADSVWKHWQDEGQGDA